MQILGGVGQEPYVQEAMGCLGMAGGSRKLRAILARGLARKMDRRANH